MIKWKLAALVAAMTNIDREDEMAEKKRQRVTTRTLQKKMENGEQIVQMAIYDYRSAVIADR